MLKQMIRILAVIIVLFNFLYAQNIQPEDKIKIERGNEIINLARKAIFKKTKMEDVKSIQVNKVSRGVLKSIKKVEGHEDLVSSSEVISENNFAMEFPNKVKITVISYKPNANPAEDYTKLEMVSNGSEYQRGMEIIRGGKRVDLTGVAAKLPSSISAPVKGQITNIVDQMNKTGQDPDLTELWSEVFPVLLNTPWDSSATFTFVGKAKSSDTQADIVEVKSAMKNQIRLFFDENTHLLLMMTISSNDGSRTREDKYFFSNYELVNGIMTAKKINYESDSVNNEKLALAGLPTVLRNTMKTVTETTIKEFKLNPTFSSDFFTPKKK